MTRKNFSDNQKATIYARDRATCSFSTKSLWSLDYGIITGWVVDWVDHIIPCAHGGNADLTNGVCASDYFNSKKKADITDDQYLVKHGKLTDHYIEQFGSPPASLVNQLQRLDRIDESDWFFNRVIVGAFVGFECRCDKEFKRKEWKRDDEYWFNSAWKRLQIFHRRKSQPIEDRQLIKKVRPHGTDLLLHFESVTSMSEFKDVLEAVYPLYRENYKAVYDYFNYENAVRKRTAFIKSLEDKKTLNPIVLGALKGHNMLEMGIFRSAID